MTNILVLDSAATGPSSVSRGLTRSFAEQLQRAHPGFTVTRRDIGADPVPHLTEDSAPVIRGAAPHNDSAAAALALSDTLIAELEKADLLLIGAPMYNFGMASTLKAWFDHVLRSGITFRYGDAGPEGLMKGKTAIVVETRGGLYSDGPGAAMDSQEPHLRTLLGFMGIDDVTFVRSERLGFGPDIAAASVIGAERQLSSLVAQELAIAA